MLEDACRSQSRDKNGTLRDFGGSNNDSNSSDEQVRRHTITSRNIGDAFVLSPTPNVTMYNTTCMDNESSLNFRTELRSLTKEETATENEARKKARQQRGNSTDPVKRSGTNDVEEHSNSSNNGPLDDIDTYERTKTWYRVRELGEGSSLIFGDKEFLIVFKHPNCSNPDNYVNRSCVGNVPLNNEIYRPPPLASFLGRAHPAEGEPARWMMRPKHTLPTLKK